MSLNHDANPDTIREGTTILLPANKLSKRDAEILSGIGHGTYRLYPVRKGEKLSAIMSARKISEAELKAINPGLDMTHVTGETDITAFLRNDLQTLIIRNLIPYDAMSGCGVVHVLCA